MAEQYKSSILAELDWRGFIQDIAGGPALDEALALDSMTLYCGFDPTARSLHVGNLVGIMALAHFRRHGHQPLALVGGATGRIGDPSGKDQERELLAGPILEENIAAFDVQLKHIMLQADELHAADTADGDADFELINNFDWLKDVTFLDFLRDVGKFFSVNAMISKESVRARLEEREQGISYTEFSYMLIQAYDFLHLYESRDCRLQIGGSDQWGNITAGTELIRKTSIAVGPKAFGLTFPLLTSAEGKKLGKSEKGAVFLDPELTSPYEFYQYWVNREDADCGKLLRVFTFLPKEEIEELEQRIEAGENRGEVQQKLATEVTTLIHGEKEAEKVVRASRMLFGEKIEGLTDRDLKSIFADVPSTDIERSRLRSEEMDIIDALTQAGLQKSRGAARRLIKQGGAYVNNVKITDHEHVLTEDELASESMMVVRSGKKKYHVLRFVEE